MTSTFYSEESANRRNSLLLAFIVIAFLAVFGFVIGFSIGYGSGNEVAFGIGALAIAVGIGTLEFSRPSGYVGTSAAAVQRHKRDGGRSRRPDAQGLHHRRPFAKRLRDRP